MDAGNGVWLILILAAAVGLGGLVCTRQLVRTRQLRREPVPDCGTARGAAVVGGLAGVLSLGVALAAGAACPAEFWPGHSLPALVAGALAIGLVAGVGAYWQCLLVLRGAQRLRAVGQEWLQGRLATGEDERPA